jgi:hypothetical protein
MFIVRASRGSSSAYGSRGCRDRSDYSVRGHPVEAIRLNEPLSDDGDWGMIWDDPPQAPSVVVYTTMPILKSGQITK